MKSIISSLFVLATLFSHAQESSNRALLTKHLKESHDENNWFVSVKSALKDLSAEQAMWKDGSGNHSAGQLAHHLLFWNERLLKSFRGEKNENFSGNNTETFDKFDSRQWNDVVSRLDKVLTELEAVVQNASEDQLKEWAPQLINISAHNAYHTGQIVFVRKLQGSWKAEYGVN
jgi:uncharacterized damage-inducible protein DinB